MQPNRLYNCCQHCLLRHSRHLVSILEHVTIPASVHVELFTVAVMEVHRSKGQYGEAISALVSNWPHSDLVLSELLPSQQISSMVHASDGQLTVLEMIMSGLLNLRPQAKLLKINFSCVVPDDIFHLPVLYLPTTDTLWDDLIDHITKQSELFADNDDDTMSSVLSWKMTEISKRKSHLSSTYRGPVSLEVCLQTKVCLTEWVAMIDGIIGLCTQNMSPFKFKFTQLSVDSFTIADSKLLKWILNIVDNEVLRNLYIYGKKKHMRLCMWELSRHLSRIPHLITFGVGSTGPRIYSQFISPYEPTPDECFKSTSAILQQWQYLQELQLVGLVLSNCIEYWLSPLQIPLKRLSLYACKLTKTDLNYLTKSCHLPNLTHLELAKDNFRGCGEELCAIVKLGAHLEVLNLRKTNLTVEEKVSILCMLQGIETLHTLVLYEQEDLLSSDGYQTLVELACGVPSLKNFYVFPFNYKPFEILHRTVVEEASECILNLNERTDIQLLY